MSNHESFQERLKKFQAPEAIEAKRIAALKKLSEKLRDVGFAYLGRDMNGEVIQFITTRNGQPIVDAQVVLQMEKRCQNILVLSDEERMPLFEALTLQLAPYVQQAWDQMDKGVNLWVFCVSNVGCVPQVFPFRKKRDKSSLQELRFKFFSVLIKILSQYDQPLTWWAEWSLGVPSDEICYLMAVAIEADDPMGQEVYQILKSIALGEHETAPMGRHVPTTLLNCKKEEGWELVAKLLATAQRQEGLRQVIFQELPFSYPDAFKKFLKIILEERLYRFSSLICNLPIWFGYNLDSEAQAIAKDDLELVSQFLDDPSKAQAVLDAGNDANAVYLALWSIAFEDQDAAVEKGEVLMSHPDDSIRYITLHLLVHISSKKLRSLLEKAINDSNPLIAKLASQRLFSGEFSIDPQSTLRLFGSYEAMLQNAVDKPKKIKSLVGPGEEYQLGKETVLGWIARCTGKVPFEKILKHYGEMNVDARHAVACTLKDGNPDLNAPVIREFFFEMIGDASEPLRDVAFEVLREIVPTVDEVKRLEIFMTRKSEDLRRKVLMMLARQSEDQMIASARRMTESRNSLTIQGGLELLVKLRYRKDLSESLQTQMAKIVQDLESDSQNSKKRTKAQEKLLNILKPSKKTTSQSPISIKKDSVTPLRTNALGLMDPKDRAPIPMIEAKPEVLFYSEAAHKLLLSLDAFIEKHRGEPIRFRGNDEMQLGTIGHNFPSMRDGENISHEQMLEKLPLRALWESWLVERPEETKDADGFELFRAESATSLYSDSLHAGSWRYSLEKEDLPNHVLFRFTELEKLKYSSMIKYLLPWLSYLSLKPEKTTLFFDYLLDLYEASLYLLPLRSKVDNSQNASKLSVSENYEKSKKSYQGSLEQRNSFTYCLWRNRAIDLFKKGSSGK